MGAHAAESPCQQHIPIIELRRPVAAEVIVGELRAALQRFPWGALVRGQRPCDDATPAARLVRAVSEISDQPLSFTRVEEGQAAKSKADAVSRISRTNAAMPLHTDSSYAASPHELVVFQMVRATVGGNSLVLPVDALTRRLPDAVQTVLRRPVFPFGRNRCAILSGRGSPRIRYYAEQLRTSAALQDASLPPEERRAVAALDEALEEAVRRGEPFRSLLSEGDMLVLNNARCLHGRTAFPAGAGRLMHRVRARAPFLA